MAFPKWLTISHERPTASRSFNNHCPSTCGCRIDGPEPGQLVGKTGAGASYACRQPGLLGSVRWKWIGPMPVMAMIAGSDTFLGTPS
jgi:hypothetical protein